MPRLSTDTKFLGQRKERKEEEKEDNNEELTQSNQSMSNTGIMLSSVSNGQIFQANIKFSTMGESMAEIPNC